MGLERFTTMRKKIWIIGFHSPEESQSDEALDNLEWDLARPGAGQHRGGPRQLQLRQCAHQHLHLDLGHLRLPGGLCVQVGDRTGGGGSDEAWNTSSKNLGFLISRPLCCDSLFSHSIS